VAADAVEDVVQEALRIIVEKGVTRPGVLGPDGEPGLAYAFQVLRHVIGNHYQKERTRRRRLGDGEAALAAADPAPGPLLALASQDAVSLVHACLARMERDDAPCAGRLRGLADGRTPRELARAERVEEAAFYRRLYRCRLKLRALLAERGFFA
jgi:DNA-directed RNA polymerase specialized sigma24 family protein